MSLPFRGRRTSSSRHERSVAEGQWDSVWHASSSCDFWTVGIDPEMSLRCLGSSHELLTLNLLYLSMILLSSSSLGQISFCLKNTQWASASCPEPDLIQLSPPCTFLHLMCDCLISHTLFFSFITGVEPRASYISDKQLYHWAPSQALLSISLAAWALNPSVTVHGSLLCSFCFLWV